MTIITSNGSKWAGEAPDSVDKLCEVLSEYVLNRLYESEDSTGFINPETGGTVRFFGNFLHLSHVFNIRTDEAPIIKRLTALIRANQARTEYLEQPSAKQRREADERYYASVRERNKRQRAARGIVD